MKTSFKYSEEGVAPFENDPYERRDLFFPRIVAVIRRVALKIGRERSLANEAGEDGWVQSPCDSGPEETALRWLGDPRTF